MIRKLIVVVGIGVLVTGCFGREPSRTRWAPGSMPLDEPLDPRLSISSIPAEVTSLKAKDLSEGAASAYIDALAIKIPNASEFRAVLADAIKPTNRGDADRTVLNRTMAVSVSNRGYSATRRLIETRITIIPQNFVFTGYTLAKTEFQAIDLEAVSISRTTTTNAGVGLKFGNAVEAADASVTLENKEGTTYINRERTEALTVKYTPARIEFYQRGLPGHTLTGMLLANAGARPRTLDAIDYETVVAGMNIMDRTGVDLPPAKASVVTVVDKLMRGQSLVVCAKVDYVERKVTSGGEFVDEGRQRIKDERKTSIAQEYEFVSGDQVAPLLWAIALDNGLVAIDTPQGPQSFSFSSEIDAARFANWMERTGAATVGKLQLYGTGAGGLAKLATLKGRNVRVQALQASPQPFVPKPCAVPDET